MKQYNVHPSDPFASCSNMQWVCCCGPSGQEISIDCCTTGTVALCTAAYVGNATFSVYVGS